MRLIVAAAILYFSEGADYHLVRKSYKDIFKIAKQCTKCGIYSICNFVILPIPGGGKLREGYATGFERAAFFPEEGTDECRCKDVPDITRDAQPATKECLKFRSHCGKCSNKFSCIEAFSTYYCDCTSLTNKYMGQHCEYEISVVKKGYTHQPPGLSNLLRLPRNFEVYTGGHSTKFLPSLYFSMRPVGYIFHLDYIYDGRLVQVDLNDKDMFRLPSYLEHDNQLKIIYKSVPMAVDWRTATWMEDQQNTFPLSGDSGRVNAHCIFLDHRMRIELDAPDNVIAKNKDYKWKSIGRVAQLSVIVFSKPGDYFLPTHRWLDLRVFVPYERHFLPCSYKITITIRGVKCSDDINKPTSVFIKNPVRLTASRERWFDDATCYMRVVEHRWNLIKTRLTKNRVVEETETVNKHSHLVEHVRPLKKKWSTSDTKLYHEEHFLKAAESRYPKSKLWLVIYDLLQAGHPEIHASGHEFQARKLCFLAAAEGDDLPVYPAEREKTVSCGKTHKIDMVNDNPVSFPNSDIEIKWTCVDDEKNECKNMTTKGEDPYVTDILACEKKYKITLFITYLKNDPKTLTKYDEVSLNSKQEPTQVIIKCLGTCPHTVNKGNVISLSATETPETSSPWTWEISYAKNSKTGVQYIKLSDAQVAGLRTPNTDANVFVIQVAGILQEERYSISASTRSGQDSYSFSVNPGTTPGTCTISPKSGMMGKPIFNVSCRNWGKKKGFLPLVYKVVEEYPLSSYPIVSSLDEDMSNLILYHNKISVLVTDSRGDFFSYPLTGINLIAGDEVEKDEFYQYLGHISKQLLGNGGRVALEIMGDLVRKMKTTGTTFQDDWMIDLLDQLSRVDPIIDVVDVQRGLDVMNRMLECKFPPDSVRTDEALIATSIQFDKISEAVTSMMDSEDYNLYDRNKLIPYMIQGASLILNRRDNIIVRDALEEDVNERHVQLVKRSTVSALESMENMARALERDVLKTFVPYKLKIGGLDLLVTAKNLSKINEEMQKVNDTHTFTFSPETLKKYGGTQVTLTKLSSGSNSAFWFEGDAAAGIMDIVLTATGNNSVEIRKEPVDVFLKMANFSGSSETMEGVLKPPPPCYRWGKADKSVSIHQLKLPDGEGAVYLRFPGNLVNMVKIISSQSQQPTYDMANSTSVLSEKFHVSVFSNYNNTMETDFYIGIIPQNIKRPPEPYAFNLTIMRCAIWIGERFESRGCKFIELITSESIDNPTLRCKCLHQSWFSASFFLPPHKIVLSQDLHLFSTILDNFYVPLLVAFMLLFLIIVIVWGHRKDLKDLEERNVVPMEDNYPGDTYPYIIAVFTGERFGSGTSSRVAIRVLGVRGMSRVHMLSSDKRQVLALGADDWFLLNTSNSLGKIKAVQLWHNHTGSRPEWYCRRVVVYDITVQKEYEFAVERWFTFDGSVPAEEARMYQGNLATEEEKSKKWYYLITGWAFSELREKHHWASIFTRHPRSLYTRCQRAMIAVGLIMTTMLVSMMFFDVNAVGPADLPAAGFSFEELWISIKSAIISVLMTMAIVFCFQKSKKKDLAEIDELQKEKNTPKAEVKNLSRSRLITSSSYHLNLEQKYLGLLKKVLALGLIPKPIPYKSVTYNAKEKNQSLVPKIFLILAWTVSSMTLIIVSFFLVLYGLKFGPKKSLVWALTFMSGSITSTFIMEPIKMIILATLISLFFKKSNMDAFTMQINYKVTQDETPRSKIQQLEDYYRIRMDGSNYHPSLTEWIKSRSSKLFSTRAVRYLIVYGIFYSLMLAIVGFFLAFIQIKVEHYSVRQIAYHFKETTHPEFEDIISKKSMYNFIHRSAVPSLHRVLWYNNRSLPLEKGEKEPHSNKPRFSSEVKGWFQGYTNKLLGVPRLRQLRLNKNDREETDEVFFGHYFDNANGQYQSWLEDKKAYLPTWKKYDGKGGKLNQLWIYTPPYDTGSVYGKSFKLYDGGGYFYLLDWNMGGSQRKLQYLEMNEWVNNLTRCVFLEINLYNNDLKLFTTIRLIIEALPNGFYSFRPQFETASLFFKKKPETQAILILMGILAVVLIGYAIFSFVQFSRIGFVKYFATFRGFCDVILLAIGLTSISSFLQRSLHFSLFVEYLDSSPHDKYVSLYTPFLSDEKAHNFFGAFTMMLAVCMGVNMIQLISIGRFHWVFHNVVSMLIIVVFLNTLFNVLLSALSLTFDREFYDLFVFQFTFKQERLGIYQVDQNRIFFVLVTPIVIGLLKFNLAGVIYYYNTLEEKPKTALAIFHGEKNIKHERRSKRKFNMNKANPTVMKEKIDRIFI